MYPNTFISLFLARFFLTNPVFFLFLSQDGDSQDDHIPEKRDPEETALEVEQELGREHPWQQRGNELQDHDEEHRNGDADREGNGRQRQEHEADRKGDQACERRDAGTDADAGPEGRDDDRGLRGLHTGHRLGEVHVEGQERRDDDRRAGSGEPGQQVPEAHVRRAGHGIRLRAGVQRGPLETEKFKGRACRGQETGKLQRRARRGPRDRERPVGGTVQADLLLL